MSNRSKRSGPRAGAPLHKVACPHCGWRTPPSMMPAHMLMVHGPEVDVGEELDDLIKFLDRPTEQ